jgi:hypothetical protein
MVINNRPKYGENVEDLTDINDIRNGVFLKSDVHHIFDSREAAILKVRHTRRPMSYISHISLATDAQSPNHVLDTTDIPRQDRLFGMPEGVTYPENKRYTFQWLTSPDPVIVLNNIDAAFKIRNRDPKPSDLLLHYNYGAAAVKCWGHGEDILDTHVPRPSPPPLAPKEHPRTQHDRTIAIQKRHKARQKGGDGGNVTAGDQPGEDNTRWDEDDIMLFFWSHTPAAIERNRKKQAESTQSVEQWRRGVPSI